MAAVKIASAQIKSYRRKLIAPLATAHGAIKERYGFIVSIASDEFHTGYGEIPLPLFVDDDLCDPATVDHYALMEAATETLIGKDIPSSLEDVEVDIEHLFPAMDSCVYFGLETALCDLAAKVVGHPLSHWLSPDPRSSVPVNYLIRRPVGDWDMLAATISDHGYHAVKAKVAVDSIDDDIEFIDKLRKKLGDDIAIRLDANRGWEFDQAVAVLERLSEFDLDYIEEPLAEFNADNLAELKKKTMVSIALDESIAEVGHSDDLLTAKVADVLILKPSIIGGLARTLDIIKLASANSYRYVITTNLETDIGTASLVHLAAAVPGDLPPCGLDTLRLFQDADPILTKIADGAIDVPTGGGLGVGEELWARL